MEHIFNETAQHARALASNRLARANRASHGPRVRAKERVKTARANPKEYPQGTKGAKGKGKTSKTGLSGLDNSKTERSSETQESAPTYPTDNSTRTLPGMVMTGVQNGRMTGVLLDGTKVGIKRMTIPQAHFHLEVWILVP